MDTLLTNKRTVSKEEFYALLFENCMSLVEEYIVKLDKALRKFTSYLNAYTYYKVVNQDIYIDLKQRMIFQDFEKLSTLDSEDSSSLDEEIFATNYKFVEGLNAEIPSLKWLRSKKAVIEDVYGLDSWFACICDDGRLTLYLGLIVAYNPSRDTICVLADVDYVYIAPIHKMTREAEMDLIFDYILPYRLFPENLDSELVQLLNEINWLNRNGYNDVSVSPMLVIDKSKLLEDVMNNMEDEQFSVLSWELTSVLKKYVQEKSIMVQEKRHTRDELLQCEKMRADIEPYEDRILTDPNRGHWDLWEDCFDEEYTVVTDEKLMARNPECDINENGVIAIDFGTKSTIVVYQSDIEHSLPMGIGDGNLSKGPTSKKYENPTVMHFVNIQKFYEDYNATKGRPSTKCNDLTI